MFKRGYNILEHREYLFSLRLIMLTKNLRDDNVKYKTQKMFTRQQKITIIRSKR